MLKRLKFPEHGIDLAVDSDSILYVSFDTGSIEGAPMSYTVIVFKNLVNGLEVVPAKKRLDSMQAGKLHNQILDILFKV